MNMFKPVEVTSRKDYFAMLNDERKEPLTFLDKFIQESVPAMKPWFTYNMLGYGAFDYINYKKEQIQWPVIAMASQKNYISIYVCALDGDQYIAEKYEKELGKVNVGKSCIRFKKLEDLNLTTLKKVLLAAAKAPGLISASTKKDS